jgi:hypothetical protein
MPKKRKAGDDEDSEDSADFTDSEDEAFIDDGDSDDGTSSKRRYGSSGTYAPERAVARQPCPPYTAAGLSRGPRPQGSMWDLEFDARYVISFVLQFG